MPSPDRSFKCRPTYPTCTSKAEAPNPKSSSFQANPFPTPAHHHPPGQPKPEAQITREDLSLSSRYSTVILPPFP